MPLPVPNLDDRRFDDLVAEAEARLASHLPELTQIAPGDPVHSFVDLFAWLTETVLYRANLIPERLRRVILNMLQVPVRRAVAARGVVCIDAGPRSPRLPSLVRDGAPLRAGNVSLTALGELQPTPLQLLVAIKETVSGDSLQALGFTLQDLHEQYGLRSGETPQPFQPRSFEPGKETLSLSTSLDQAYYLAFAAPRQLESSLVELRENLAGITLNLAIAPADEREGDEVSELRPRQLIWELMSEGEAGEVILLPLEVLADSSLGGRRAGVVRLRLPRNAALFKSLASDDPMFAGLGDLPPELPTPMSPGRVAFWLRLRCAEEPELPLGYLGVNAVDVVAQGQKRDLMLGIGTGQPDQVLDLPDTDIEPESLELEVEEDGAWVPWRRVEFLLGWSSADRVYRLDATAGRVHFGDGLDGGKRPPEGRRIRIARYLHGGGAVGNLSAGDIKELVGSARLTVRHEWPLKGGIDAETVDQAEQRIPQYLTHRNRAVTRADFKILTESNPVNPVGRAEVLEGFLPGASIRAARSDVPGVVSVFVLKPGAPTLGHTPKATQGLLKDVFNYLLDRVLIGTELYVLSPEFVPIAVGVKVDVRDPETEQQTLRAVHDALITYLWPVAPGGAEGGGWPLGGTVRGGELMTQVARVAGVKSVNALSLFQKAADGWRRLAADTPVTLAQYQLPELMGVSVGSGGGDPQFPSGIGPLAGEPPRDLRNVPAPIIPDVC